MKIKVDSAMIARVAGLARLNLTDKEKEQFAHEIKDILDAFSKIDEVDTKGIGVSVQPIELKNALREDKAKSCLKQEEALSLSSNKKDGYFKGPKAV